jgi:hypothetical protein
MIRPLAVAIPLTLLLGLEASGCYRGTQGGGAGGAAGTALGEALGEGKCREVPKHATPLVMDWTAHDRTDLEVAMAKDGLALVRRAKAPSAR